MTSTAWFPPADKPSAETDLILSFTLAGQRETTPLHVNGQDGPTGGQELITISGATTIGTDAEFAAALLGSHQGTPLLSHPHNSGQGEA